MGKFGNKQQTWWQEAEAESSHLRPQAGSRESGLVVAGGVEPQSLPLVLRFIKATPPNPSQTAPPTGTQDSGGHLTQTIMYPHQTNKFSKKKKKRCSSAYIIEVG